MTQTRRTPASGEAWSARGDDELSLPSLLDFILEHRRLVLGTGLCFAVLAGAIAFARPRTYSSTARFMPESQESPMSGLSGLAATFGVSVLGTDQGSSPSFYAQLLQSRDILRETVETRYAFSTGTDSLRGTLITLFRARGSTPAARRDAAAKTLLKDLDVTVGRETGTVDLTVTTRWAELSQQVGARLVELVSEFNLHRRQTKAGAERRFVEARVAEAQDSLRAAESRLQEFLQRNRVYQNAPQLQFEYDRLERAVNMRQQVYTTLSQSYEAARIDEVRNTPVITIMEPPDLPAKPDARLALVKALLAGLLGLALGAFAAAIRRAFGPGRHSLLWGRRSGHELGDEGAGRDPLVPRASGPLAK
jgi:uncharacterized protein involved in exopolysaccharide biosynthesis